MIRLSPRMPYLVAAVAFAAPTPTAAQEPLVVHVDERIELLGVLQLIAGGGPTTTDLEFPYQKAVEERFGPYAAHPAVAMMQRMAKSGFAFDAPVIALLHCSAPPNVTLTRIPPPEIVQRSGGVDTLTAWVALVRAFATESGFAEFFSEHAPWYDDLAGQVDRMLEPNLVDDLEDYYGMRQEGYRIILSTLTKGGFGPRVEINPGVWRLYAVASPAKYSADTLRFFTPSGLRNLVWHEFAHSFVNPLTESHWADLEPHGELLDSIVDGLPQWYRQWKPALDEHIVRAITVRMAAKYRGNAAGAKAMAQQVEWGFAYVPAMAELLEQQYEPHRDRWPDFATFFPEVVRLVRSLAHPR